MIRTIQFPILLATLIVMSLPCCQAPIEHDKDISVDLDSIPAGLSLFAKDIISTPLYERDLAISPLGDELVYTLGDYKQTRRCLVSMKKLNGTWQEPKILPFSGRYQDIEPFFATDADRLYFASNRPIFGDNNRTDYNIWWSDKKDEMWMEPQPLDSVINTQGDEFFPSLSNNGNLYFTATRENGMGREDIFRSEYTQGKFQVPTPLPESINSASFEFNAYISPEEDLIVFSSFGRDDGLGGGDLYFSRLDEKGDWAESQNMGQVVNSDKLDFCPFIDWRTRIFYFTSEQINPFQDRITDVQMLRESADQAQNGFGNIYRISLEEIGIY